VNKTGLTGSVGNAASAADVSPTLILTTISKRKSPNYGRENYRDYPNEFTDEPAITF
jgi:hypothetical protein